MVLLVLVLVVTGVKQSQLLVLRLSLEFDKNQTKLTSTELGNTSSLFHPFSNLLLLTTYF